MTAGPPVGLEVTTQLRQQLKSAWEMVSRMTRDGDPNASRAVSEMMLKLVEMVMVHDIHVSKVVTDFQEKIQQVQQQAQSQGNWSGNGGSPKMAHKTVNGSKGSRRVREPPT